MFHLKPTLYDYFFVEQVFMPTNVYKGQKLIKLVSANIIAKTTKMSDNVPLMTPVKYSTAINAATDNLISLSVRPMFFIMIFKFIFLINKYFYRCKDTVISLDIMVTSITYFNINFTMITNKY